MPSGSGGCCLATITRTLSGSSRSLMGNENFFIIIFLCNWIFYTYIFICFKYAFMEMSFNSHEKLIHNMGSYASRQRYLNKFFSKTYFYLLGFSFWIFNFY
jgi:hypothetical protein